MKLHARVSKVLASTIYGLDNARSEVTLDIYIVDDDAASTLVFPIHHLVLEMPYTFQTEHFPFGALIHFGEISTELP